MSSSRSTSVYAWTVLMEKKKAKKNKQKTQKPQHRHETLWEEESACASATGRGRGGERGAGAAELDVSRVHSSFPSFHLSRFPSSSSIVSENRGTDSAYPPCRRNADGEMLHSSLIPHFTRLFPTTLPSLINQEI